MNILIVYAHPSKESFTYKILNELIRGLSDAEHVITISDLYSINFLSNMSETEYQREGLQQPERIRPDDVLEEQKKLNNADGVIFLYPIWWSDCPAIMKGWFDRVYTLNYAYGYDDTLNSRMKQIKYGLALCTAGNNMEILENKKIALAMKTIMLKDRFAYRFLNQKMIILDNTVEMELVEKKHLEQAYKIGNEFEKQFLRAD